MNLIKKITKLIKKDSKNKENKQENQSSSDDNKNQEPSLSHTLSEFVECTDIIHRTFSSKNIDIIYFGHLIDNDEILRDVINPFNELTTDQIEALLQETHFRKITDRKEFIKGILYGEVAVFFQKQAYLINVYGPEGRTVTESETESVIVGPHDAFIESAGTNLSLLRRRIKSSHLKTIKISVGEISKTTIYILYIKDIANEEMVQDLVDRLKLIEIDGVYDANMLIQLIDESPNSIFPQFLTTERPDVASSKLLSGKIVGIIDNSPSAFCSPTSFFEFFQSPDDYYQRWIIGSGLRYLRYLAFFITIIFTPLYVSVTTFHYEMIPESLLLTLAESRKKVPFPPLIEAVLMEITLELLREAGARLPTKVGQTIGIVGGIVIGQAAVQAGLTSNILIIAVATSAIASFVIPSYIMSASIRLVRFPLLILSGTFGNFGILLGLTILVIHLSKLTSLHTSYLTPVAPLYSQDWKDIFLRTPYSIMKERPTQGKPVNSTRIQKKR